jgi:hypothetical protein
VNSKRDSQSKIMSAVVIRSAGLKFGITVYIIRKSKYRERGIERREKKCVVNGYTLDLLWKEVA